MFKKRENIYDIEEGNLLSPKFDNDGLIKRISNDDKHRKKMVKNNKMVDKSFPPNDKSLEEIKSNYL